MARQVQLTSRRWRLPKGPAPRGSTISMVPTNFRAPCDVSRRLKRIERHREPLHGVVILAVTPPHRHRAQGNLQPHLSAIQMRARSSFARSIATVRQARRSARKSLHQADAKPQTLPATLPTVSAAVMATAVRAVIHFQRISAMKIRRL